MKIERRGYMKEESNLKDIIVIKRNGKKVSFDETKIALAIQKGFDSVDDEDNRKYDTKDTQKVLDRVIKNIEEQKPEKLKIEEIQDLIESSLKHYNYNEVYESFSNYRERRRESREFFFDDKKKIRR